MANLKPILFYVNLNNNVDIFNNIPHPSKKY